MEGKYAYGCCVCGSHLLALKERIFDTRFGIDGHFNIYQCNSCGLVQLPLYQSSDNLIKVYETFYNFGGSKKSLYNKLRKTFLESTIYRLWMVIDGDICFHSRCGNGRLLDIGCNEGRGLQIYKDNRFDVEGLELNELAAIKARKAGFRVHTTPIETFQPNDLYDIIVLSNVLEHSLQPKAMLAHVARILKPGGHIWISCPNIDSWQRLVFSKYWINWHVPFHIVHFSKSALSRLLNDCGFKVIKIRQLTPALWMAQSVTARFFSKPGKPTKQLRNPFLVALLMLLIRGLLFPLLWLGNRLSRGDCLVVVARKPLNPCAY